MEYNDAIEIVELYEYYIDKDCICFRGNPPCSRCELMPPEEIYKEALKVIEK